MPAPDPKELDRANLMRGRFVSVWSWVEMRLRALELMHVGNYQFKPVDLDKVRLKSGKRFRERAKEVIPPGDTLDWLLYTHKIRNLVLHGVLIVYDGDLVLVHADMQATLEAGQERNEAKIPTYPHSVPPDSVFSITECHVSIAKAHQIAGYLLQPIETAHKYGESRLRSSPDGKDTICEPRRISN